jgi:hypothetical protein
MGSILRLEMKVRVPPRKLLLRGQRREAKRARPQEEALRPLWARGMNIVGVFFNAYWTVMMRGLAIWSSAKAFV